MSYVNFGRKETRANALASTNKDKIFFPSDDNSIILGGKEYGINKADKAKLDGAVQSSNLFDVDAASNKSIKPSLIKKVNSIEIGNTSPLEIKEDYSGEYTIGTEGSLDLDVTSLNFNNDSFYLSAQQQLSLTSFNLLNVHAFTYLNLASDDITNLVANNELDVVSGNQLNVISEGELDLYSPQIYIYSDEDMYIRATNKINLTTPYLYLNGKEIGFDSQGHFKIDDGLILNDAILINYTVNESLEIRGQSNVDIESSIDVYGDLNVHSNVDINNATKIKAVANDINFIVNSFNVFQGDNAHISIAYNNINIVSDHVINIRNHEDSEIVLDNNSIRLNHNKQISLQISGDSRVSIKPYETKLRANGGIASITVKDNSEDGIWGTVKFVGERLEYICKSYITGTDGADYTLDVNGNITSYLSVTYAQLADLKRNNALHPGTIYRITDYTCVIENYAGFSSANHPFDILVTATSNNTFSEDAKAVKHEGDTYYLGNLNAWSLKYCFDNDTSRFDWATANGKGVIYELIDDLGNDLPYDFKNILKNNRFTFDAFSSDNPMDTTESPNTGIRLRTRDNIITFTKSVITRLRSTFVESSMGSYNNVIKSISPSTITLKSSYYNTIIDAKTVTLKSSYYNTIIDARTVTLESSYYNTIIDASVVTLYNSSNNTVRVGTISNVSGSQVNNNTIIDGTLNVSNTAVVTSNFIKRSTVTAKAGFKFNNVKDSTVTNEISTEYNTITGCSSVTLYNNADTTATCSYNEFVYCSTIVTHSDLFNNKFANCSSVRLKHKSCSYTNLFDSRIEGLNADTNNVIFKANIEDAAFYVLSSISSSRITHCSAVSIKAINSCILEYVNNIQSAYDLTSVFIYNSSNIFITGDGNEKLYIHDSKDITLGAENYNIRITGANNIKFGTTSYIDNYYENIIIEPGVEYVNLYPEEQGYGLYNITVKSGVLGNNTSVLNIQIDSSECDLPTGVVVSSSQTINKYV